MRVGNQPSSTWTSAAMTHEPFANYGQKEFPNNRENLQAKLSRYLHVI